MSRVNKFFDCPEELVVGFIFGFAWVGFMGLWAFLLGAVVSVLWRLGGSGLADKAVRRYGVPVLLAAATAPFLKLYALSILPIIGVLCLGYGIPSDTDEGSAVGRFWAQYIFARNWCDFATRATAGLACAVIVFPTWFVNPFGYMWAAVWMGILYPLSVVLVE